MVDFGGWEMPQQYSSIRDEHLAVRRAAGLFDVSHMGRVRIEGAGAEAYLQRLLTNDVASVEPGQAGYSQMSKVYGSTINDRLGHVWDAILEAGRSAGVLPAGLGARDATRLEAALRLYGNDMDETVNPYEAGLGWTVKLTKGDFIGSDALKQIKAQGPRRTLIGLQTEPGSIARHGAAGMSEGRRVGAGASGTHSSCPGYPLAPAMLE